VSMNRRPAWTPDDVAELTAHVRRSNPDLRHFSHWSDRIIALNAKGYFVHILHSVIRDEIARGRPGPRGKPVVTSVKGAVIPRGAS
jgi:hypothetical protein